MNAAQESGTRTLSQEALDLAEYRVLEKVQEKLLGRAKIALGIFAAGLTLLGFFGGAALTASVSGAVEKELSAKLEKNAAALDERLRTTLVNLQVSAAEVQRATADARKKLEFASADIERLSELSERYSKLNSEVESLTQRIGLAVANSSAALKDTKELRRAAVDAVAGRPSLLETSFSWGRPSDRNGINGSNFGDQPGKVSLRLSLSTIDLTHPGSSKPKAEVFSDWIPIDSKSIKSWSNSKIALSFSDEFNIKFTLARQELYRKLPDGNSSGYDYRVETRDGLTSQMKN